MSDGEELTAWGVWIRSQPRGTLSRAQLSTKLAWSTVHGAQKKLVSRDVAEALSKFTKGEVKASQLIKRKQGAAARSAA